MQKNHVNTTKLPANACSTCIKSLAVDARMQVYEFLKTVSHASVTQITNITKLSQSTVSYHLKEMTTSGLLLSTKAGKNVLYSLSPTCPTYNCSCIFKNIKFPTSVEVGTK